MVFLFRYKEKTGSEETVVNHGESESCEDKTLMNGRGRFLHYATVQPRKQTGTGKQRKSVTSALRNPDMYPAIYLK